MRAHWQADSLLPVRAFFKLLVKYPPSGARSGIVQALQKAIVLTHLARAEASSNRHVLKSKLYSQCVMWGAAPAVH